MQWQLRRVTGLGQVIELTALARGDVYHTSDSALAPVDNYRGTEGWQGRTVALAALDVSWPLVGPLFGGSQVLTPRVQLVGVASVGAESRSPCSRSLASRHGSASWSSAWRPR